MKSVHENILNSNPQTNYFSGKKLVSLWPCFYFGKYGIPGAGMGLSFDLRHGPLLLTAQGTTTASPLAFGELDSPAWREVVTSLWFLQPALTHLIYI